VSGVTARHVVAALIAAFAVAFAISVMRSDAGATPPVPVAAAAGPDGPALRLATVAPLPAGPAAAAARRRRAPARKRAPRRNQSIPLAQAASGPTAPALPAPAAPAPPLTPAPAAVRPPRHAPATEVAEGFDLSG
jgi:hypothetical protein